MRRPLISAFLVSAILLSQTPPRDEDAWQKALAIPQPAAQLTAILRFFSQFPNSRSVPPMIDRAFATAGQTGSPTPERIAEMAADISKRLAKASPMARSEAERTIALRLLSGRRSLHEAEAYARQAIGNLNGDDYLAREREWYRQKVDLLTARDPNNKPLPFYPEEAREKYRGVEAATWSALGRILIKQDRIAEGRQALQKSLAAARTADAASAFADLAAKQGDTHTVLDALGTAILTGKADRPTIDKFQAAYREGGMRPDAERWLDRRYRMESRNPLETTPYRAARASPRRAVLLEMVTGAACEPCVSLDLAADALLQRYSRQDLILIAHHTHETGADPLVSPAAEQRAKYYAVRDAPAVVLDGEAIEPGEGLSSVAKPVFDALDAAIQKRISAPAAAKIDLHASWSGTALNVDATVESADGATLHVFLVETEVSYSGENGIRLHPMVTRSAARSAESGFDVKGGSFRAQWSFAIDRLPAELQKGMEGSLAGMRVQFPGRTFALRETRYPLSAGRLALVAVVQDAKTRRVLQSVFLPVESPK